MDSMLRHEKHGAPDPELQEREYSEGSVDHTGARVKTNPAEIRLVRKLDRIILPVLWTTYWFNYLDRNAITVARLDGMEEELKLASTQYQTCVSILFVGYILGQIPSSKFAKSRSDR